MREVRGGGKERRQEREDREERGGTDRTKAREVKEEREERRDRKKRRERREVGYVAMYVRDVCILFVYCGSGENALVQRDSMCSQLI